MRKYLVALLVSFVSVLAVNGEELTKERMLAHLQTNPGAFDPITAGTQPIPFEVKLGETTAVLDADNEFDGLRFTFPESALGNDMIWYFNAPGSWSNWFIIPAIGDYERGFTDWLNANKVYQSYDVDKGDRLRVFQTLDANYFEPGKEYILWFRRKNKDSKPATVRGVIAFAQNEDVWDISSLERSLKMKPQPIEAQVEVLKSRGGKVLLDKELFKRDYAVERINSVFISLRHTRNAGGGFFVTMEIAIPPCRTKTTITDIITKYGKPDFIRTSSELAQVMNHGGGKPPEQDEENVTTYYYDYFGFEVDSTDPQKQVCRVVSQADNFAQLIPVDEQAYFSQVWRKNLTVFYENKVEVGRGYFFLEKDKEPLFIKEPPAGIYKAGNTSLEYKGKGQWVRKQFYDNGTTARVLRYEKHRMNGVYEGFNKDGTKSFVANYQDGLLHGDVTEYSQDGDVRKSVFEHGKKKAVSYSPTN